MQNILDMHQQDPKIDDYLERVYRISKSFSSKRSYKVSLNKFKAFLSTIGKNLPEILQDLKNKEKDPIMLLDEYYSYLSKENMRNSTIVTWVLNHFLNA